ncbi:hypothetical protein C8K18_10760 [Paraburkholderia sp. GV068]|uniref:hypothetical protein n=1 Tax=unclassified Paraburkholderia TaxID=2615204 RepID=UPI000D31725B|nr:MULTISPECIES: hypothetical protein [unclassified Paraburkholderia]PTQ98478.1 hypothetical protein C8K19_10760 [Paraburkholderia sp. GV072]PUB03721.1 hypothetical protein C8K18_10760 [Paraburkholderia sp. GV068]
MKYRTRIYYSESQKALMWEQWRKGELIPLIGYAIKIGRIRLHFLLPRRGFASSPDETGTPGNFGDEASATRL